MISIYPPRRGRHPDPIAVQGHPLAEGATAQFGACGTAAVLRQPSRWLDCDVVFEHDDWADQSLRALGAPRFSSRFTACMSRSQTTGTRTANCRLERNSGIRWLTCFRSASLPRKFFRATCVIKQRANSGLAWVARRELLDRDGFYDVCVMGSGNRAMLCGALGTPENAIRYLHDDACVGRSTMPRGQTRIFTACAPRSAASMSTIVHLWHGDLIHRRYQERHREFSRYHYDPASDIALDDQGCWLWNSEKPAMHA